MITGDLVSGAFMHRAGVFNKYYSQIAQWFETARIPFMWVPGPSDFEAFYGDGTNDHFKGINRQSKYDMT